MNGLPSIALEAHHTEREVDMLGMFVRAIRKHGQPDALYLDNGSTYRGDILSTACARMGVSLLHARPYDPQARGKMERFWRTCVLRALRQRRPQTGFRLTYCHNVTLGRRDFYRQLCLALGLAPSATAAAIFFAVSSHVEDLGRESIHPVFLLDEAHLLHQDMLDDLHILLYQWDSKALLSLVLVGLPKISDMLVLRRNRSLYWRIHTRLAIAPLTRTTPSITSAPGFKQASRL